MSNYSLYRLQREVNDTLRKANVNHFVKVSVTGVMHKNVLGTTTTYRNLSGETVKVEIKFLKSLVLKATDETIRAVVLHECAHAICSYRYETEHGHDDTFRKVCLEIGTTNYTPYTDVKFVNETGNYKYDIFCENCGLIQSYQRTNNVIKYLNHRCCAKCHGGLRLVQNW